MKNIILGTDWWTDCDDAVALRMLCRAVKRREIRLLGICINACMEHTVPSVDGFLTLEGTAGIPLGIDLLATDFGGNPPYQARLAPYASAYKNNGDAEDIVRLYRRLLASATEPVEIVEIGYLQGFTAFMRSTGDDISPKSGLPPHIFNSDIQDSEFFYLHYIRSLCFGLLIHFKIGYRKGHYPAVGHDAVRAVAFKKQVVYKA